MITVYTKDWCGYCNIAKAYLKKHEIPFEEINIDHDNKAREYMISEGHYTAPQIYYEGKLLVEGGCDALTSLSSNEIKERMGNFDLSGLSL
jgi:glutaredoxin